MNLMKCKAGGFFSPQEEGGKCKLTIILEDQASQDAGYMMRYRDVVIGLASEVETSSDTVEIRVDKRDALTIQQVADALKAAREEKKPEEAKPETVETPLLQEES